MGEEGSEVYMPLLPTRVFDIMEPSELAFKIHNCSCHSATLNSHCQLARQKNVTIQDMKLRSPTDWA